MNSTHAVPVSDHLQMIEQNYHLSFAIEFGKRHPKEKLMTEEEVRKEIAIIAYEGCPPIEPWI